jgi:hypothetical protein
MAGETWTLVHLAQPHRDHAKQPSEQAYSATAELLARRFLHLTRRERAYQVHLGAECDPDCDLCWDIALNHVVWAAKKLHKHLVAGPPVSGGVPVRDWVTILDWVTSPLLCDTLVADLRRGLFHRLQPGDELLPLVHAVATQLLPSVDSTRSQRRMVDWVSGPRLSVLALRQGWSVRPRRDLQEKAMFVAVRERHPQGLKLLSEVLAKLDRGVVDPFPDVMAEGGPGSEGLLWALIEDLLGGDQTHAWFMTEVMARQSHNEHLARRRDFKPADAVGVADRGTSGSSSLEDEESAPR